MQNALISSPVSLQIVNGHPVTTSLDVAQHFGKRHDTVLRAIRQLDCSEEFTHRNFAASEYQDSTGRTLGMYQITRDGFVFLCMGFTGADAAKWKEAYINAFNEMEKALAERQSGRTAEEILIQAATEYCGGVRVLFSYDIGCPASARLVPGNALVFAPEDIPRLIEQRSIRRDVIPAIVEACGRALTAR